MKTHSTTKRLLVGAIIMTGLLGLTGCGNAGKVGHPQGAPRRTPPANGVLPPS